MSVQRLVIILSMFSCVLGWADLNDARASELPAEYCLGQSLARRTGTDHCWVRFDLKREQVLCFTQDQWRQWLHSKNDRICYRLDKSHQLQRRFESPELDQLQNRLKAKKVFDPHHRFDHYSRMQDKSIWHRVMKIFEKIREQVSQGLRDSDQSAVLRKLLLNESAPQSEHDVLRFLGFVHLVAPTGIHLYALSNFIFMICLALAGFIQNYIFWQGRRLTLPAELRSIAWIVSFLVFAFAWILAGCRAGMLRPWLIILLRYWAKSRGYRWRIMTPLCIALAIDLLICIWHDWQGLPGAWSPGRIHYALAVGGGLMTMEVLEKKWPSSSESLSALIRHHFHLHAALSVGSWLPTALWDALSLGFIALATPLLSLITIPIYTLFVYPVLLLSTLLPISYMQPSLQKLAVFSDSFLYFLSDFTIRLGTFWVLSPWHTLWAALVALLTLSLWQRNRSALLILLFSLIAYRSILATPALTTIEHQLQVPPPQVIRVLHWDVGQGDAALITSETQNKGGLEFGIIDSGSARGNSHGIWWQRLLKAGVHQLAWLLLTHADEDHAGGLGFIQRLLPVRCLESFHSIERCFPFYASRVQDLKENSNESMLAAGLILPCGGYYINLGDASQKMELQLLQSMPPDFRRYWMKDSKGPRILKVSHHGSETSTAPEILHLLRPNQAWISAGRGNRFGHPRMKVMQRLRDFGLKIRRTDREGDLLEEVSCSQ